LFATNNGGVFNAATNSWTAMATLNAPFGRFNHRAFWTGVNIIIWGGADMGFSGSNPQDSGAVYTP
jgi:hypothetical protein